MQTDQGIHPQQAAPTPQQGVPQRTTVPHQTAAAHQVAYPDQAPHAAQDAVSQAAAIPAAVAPAANHSAADWRESTAPQPDEELQALVNKGVDMAEHLLTSHGAFLPFGMSTDHAGNGGVLSVGQDTLSAEEQVGHLIQNFRQIRDTLRGCIVACDVTLGDGSDAVQITAESSRGNTYVLYFPYRQRRFRGGYSFSEPVGTWSHQQIWA